MFLFDEIKKYFLFILDDNIIIDGKINNIL